MSHEDVGSGDGINENKIKSHEKAIKSAVTDGMKRAARHLGDRLGNGENHRSHLMLKFSCKALFDIFNAHRTSTHNKRNNIVLALYVKGAGIKTAPLDNKQAIEQLERKEAITMFGEQQTLREKFCSHKKPVTPPKDVIRHTGTQTYPFNQKPQFNVDQSFNVNCPNNSSEQLIHQNMNNPKDNNSEYTSPNKKTIKNPYRRPSPISSPNNSGPQHSSIRKDGNSNPNHTSTKQQQQQQQQQNSFAQTYNPPKNNMQNNSTERDRNNNESIKVCDTKKPIQQQVPYSSSTHNPYQTNKSYRNEINQQNQSSSISVTNMTNKINTENTIHQANTSSYKANTSTPSNLPTSSFQSEGKSYQINYSSKANDQQVNNIKNISTNKIYSNTKISTHPTTTPMAQHTAKQHQNVFPQSIGNQNAMIMQNPSLQNNFHSEINVSIPSIATTTSQFSSENATNEQLYHKFVSPLPYQLTPTGYVQNNVSTVNGNTSNDFNKTSTITVTPNLDLYKKRNSNTCEMDSVGNNQIRKRPFISDQSAINSDQNASLEKKTVRNPYSR